MRKQGLAAAFSLLFFGCPSVDLDLFENDVSEAVFRHMFDEFADAIGTGDAPEKYFICFGYEVAVPRRGFLARFEDLPTPIARGGQSVAIEQFLPLSDEPVSGDQGASSKLAMFQVARIEQLSETEYEVEGAILIPGQDSLRSIYSVEVSSNGSPTVQGSRLYVSEPRLEEHSQVEGSLQ